MSIIPDFCILIDAEQTLVVGTVDVDELRRIVVDIVDFDGERATRAQRMIALVEDLDADLELAFGLVVERRDQAQVAVGVHLNFSGRRSQRVDELGVHRADLVRVDRLHVVERLIQLVRLGQCDLRVGVDDARRVVVQIEQRDHDDFARELELVVRILRDHGHFDLFKRRI